MIVSIWLLLFILAAIISGLSLLNTGRLKQQLSELDRLQFRLGNQAKECLRLAQSEQQLTDLQQLAETSIDGSTAAVRTVHKEIADVSFDALEKIGATRDTAKLVRGLHDLTADSVYSSISQANKLFGLGARKGLRIKKNKTNKDG